MVKQITLTSLIFSVCVSCAVYAQSFTSPSDTLAADIFDMSLIGNQSFLRIDENTFSQELQFIVDDMERIATHPLKLETATWKELQRIPTLDGSDMISIFHSKRDKNLLSSST